MKIGHIVVTILLIAYAVFIFWGNIPSCNTHVVKTIDSTGDHNYKKSIAYYDSIESVNALLVSKLNHRDTVIKEILIKGKTHAENTFNINPDSSYFYLLSWTDSFRYQDYRSRFLRLSSSQ